LVDSAGLTPLPANEGFPVCGRCHLEIGPKNPQVNAKKKRILLGIVENLTLPLCAKCFGKFKPKKLRYSTDASTRNRINQAIDQLDNGSIPTWIEELVSEVEGEINALENKFDNAFRQLENINRVKSGLIDRADSLKRRVGLVAANSYEARRKEANAVISEWEFRLMIFSRDGFKCKSCASPNRLSVDHIIPVVKGGSDDPSNLQTLCLPCNLSKGPRLTNTNLLTNSLGET